MKKGIHPDYHYIVFQDLSANHTFLTRSTLRSKKTIKWEDGNEYPLINVEISSMSHPFYTGTQKLLDTAGRVERFQKRFSKTQGKTVARKPKRKKEVSKISKATSRVLRNTPSVAPPAKSKRKKEKTSK